MINIHWHEYGEHRTGLQMDRLLHHGHVIPVTRGFTRDHVDQHFPGWTWNDLLEVCRAADLLAPDRPRGAPFACREQVKAVHFNSPRSLAVEWLDGTVTSI